MKKYRYPGTQFFTKDQKLLFQGRKEDKEKLIDYLKIFDHLVLHSKSGLGKSSLLNAGLIPEIPTPIPYFLFNIKGFDKNDPFDVMDFVFSVLNPENNKSLFNYDKEIKKSIWSELKRIQLESGSNKIYLIFDQFEQLFTHPDKIVEMFSQQLSESFHYNIPKSNRDFFEQNIRDLENKLSKEKLELIYHKIELKLLFSIRSDKMNYLDRISDYFPSILKNTMELSPFNKEQAEDAIILPAGEDTKEYLSQKFGYSSKCLQKIISFLTKDNTQPIEPFILQVICEDIEKNTIVPDKNKDIVKTEDLPILKKLFENYYQKSVTKSFEKGHQKFVSSFVEDKLIADGSIRIPCHFQVAKKYFHDQGLEEKDVDNILKKFEDFRLIRSDPYGDSFIYELSHDSLIEPIQKAKEKREEQERFLQEQKENRKKIHDAEIKADEERTLRKKEEARRKEEEALKAEAIRLRIQEEERRIKENKLKKRYFLTSIVAIISAVCVAIFLVISIKTRIEIDKAKKDLESINEKLSQTIDSLDRAKNKVQEQKDSLQIQKEIAYDERDRADSLTTVALTNENKAKIAEYDAIVAKDSAELERNEALKQKSIADTNSNINLSLSSAFESIQEDDSETKGILALNSYILNKKYKSNSFNSTIFESLYKSYYEFYPLKPSTLDIGRIETYYTGEQYFYVITEKGELVAINRDSEEKHTPYKLNKDYLYFNLEGDINTMNKYLALNVVDTRMFLKETYAFKLIDLSGAGKNQFRDTILFRTEKRIKKIRFVPLQKKWIYLEDGKLYSYKNAKIELINQSQTDIIEDFTITNDSIIYITQNGKCYIRTVKPVPIARLIHEFNVSGDKLIAVNALNKDTILAGSKNGVVFLYASGIETEQINYHNSALNHLLFFKLGNQTSYMLSMDISGLINIIPLVEIGKNAPITIQGDSRIAGISINETREELVIVYKNQKIETRILNQDRLADSLCIKLFKNGIEKYTDKDLDPLMVERCNNYCNNQH